MSTNKNQPAHTLPKHIPYAYLIYSFLNGVSSTMALTHLQFYVTEYTGISITSFVAVVTVARFADLGVSLVSGAIIQQQARVRPWQLGSMLISQTGTIMCFLNPPVSINMKLAIIVVFYCCIHFPMNFSTVANSTLLIKVAGPNPNNRLAIAAMNQRGAATMRILSSAAVVPTIVHLNTILPNGRGYFVMTCVLAVMTISAALTLNIATKPFEPMDSPKPSTTGAQTNIFKMYASAAKNIPIMVMLFCAMSTGIGGQVLSSGLQYYWRYSVGNLSLQAVQGSVAGFVSLGLTMFCPAIARKIGNRNSQKFMYCWVIMCYTINFFFASGNPWVYMIVAWVQSAGTSISGSWGNSLWVDAAEVQLYETGVDNRPFLMSLSNLPTKMGFIISGPFVAFMLNNTGYQIGADGVAFMADTSRFVKVWLTIPLSAYIIALLLFTIGYKVDPVYAKECAAKNKEAADAKRAAAAAN